MFHFLIRKHPITILIFFFSLEPHKLFLAAVQTSILTIFWNHWTQACGSVHHLTLVPEGMWGSSLCRETQVFLLPALLGRLQAVPRSAGLQCPGASLGSLLVGHAWKTSLGVHEADARSNWFLSMWSSSFTLLNFRKLHVILFFLFVTIGEVVT